MNAKVSAMHRNVLFIDYGVSFGGSIVSLSELVKGLVPFDCIHPVVLTFQADGDVLHGLFPTAKVIRKTRILSYATRFKVQNSLQSNSMLRPFAKIIMKTYALLDLIYEYSGSIAIYRLLKSNAIDFVHINNGVEPESVRAAKWASIPCVAHIRGFATGQSRLSDRRDEKTVKETVKCCIGISNVVSTSMIDAGYGSDIVKTVHNPVSAIDNSLLRAYSLEIRDKYQFDDSTVVAGVFGRVIGWKGQLELLQSVKLIVDQCPKFVLLIVGDGADCQHSDYYASLTQYIESASLQKHVIFTGYQNDVYKYYAATDIVIHSSIEPEPFGRVVIEGMVCGKPVVAVDEGGPPEIIQHEHDGLLVPPRDIDAMAAAIQRLYHDEELRKKLGLQARMTVNSNYLSHHIAAKVLRVYNQYLHTTFPIN